MSRECDIVRRQLDLWRTLKIWGKPLTHVNLTVSDTHYPRRAGTAWPTLNKVNVYYQPGLKGVMGMLKTGVHEFAHIVSPDGHGYQWQKRYAGAVLEITGEYVPSGFEDYKIMDEACYFAIQRWWKASGNEEKAKRILGVRI